MVTPEEDALKSCLASGVFCFSLGMYLALTASFLLNAQVDLIVFLTVEGCKSTVKRGIMSNREHASTLESTYKRNKR